MTKKEKMEEKLSGKGLYADKLTNSKNVWTLKKSYFYRMGQSAEQLAQALLKALPEARVLSAEDKFNRWPKTSYFVVRFEMVVK